MTRVLISVFSILRIKGGLLERTLGAVYFYELDIQKILEKGIM